MPELPEVETVRRDVAAVFAGDRLSEVRVTGRRTVRRHPPQLLAALEGHRLEDVGRHGKFLLFGWDDGQVMVGHLRMSGQLLHARPQDPLALHTHAVLAFARSGELRFVDPRTFGELFLLGATVTGPDDELAHLGPDALEVEASYLQRAFAGKKAPVKAVLTDQRVLAGIGNIYADEICFQAGVRGDRPAGSLKKAEAARLAGATRAVLTQAIAARGSTLPDQSYRDLGGNAGSFQLRHQVYNRAGQPCFRCGRPVTRPVFGARSTFLCAKCQK
jgi:formamidopyrimidine-DNA glycosylase